MGSWDLRDGSYVTPAHVHGDEHAALREPFPVEVVPADLVRPAP